MKDLFGEEDKPEELLSQDGEVIKVHNFQGGRVADIYIDSSGRFITPSGRISQESLGPWILNTLGHPASRR